MANTFGILAAVALLFGAFVAFKNKDFLADSIASTKQEERTKVTLQNSYEDLVEDISILEEEKANFEVTRDEAQTKLEEQEKENFQLQEGIIAKKSEAASAAEKADEASDTLKELGEVGDLADRMKDLQSEVHDLEDQISLQSAQVDRLEGAKATSKTAADSLVKQLADRVSGDSYFKKTKVRSVFREWGFVTLAGGDNIGVVKKSKLAVMRDGEEIAQLIVSGVEPNTSAANIIPSSVQFGVIVSPGDTVVPLGAETIK